MNIEQLRCMTKQQLCNYIVDKNVGGSVKNLITFRSGARFKLSLDQSRNPRREDITVAKFEFPAPMNIRDDAFERFNIYDITFTRETAILIHNFLMEQLGGKLTFYDEARMAP